jgi:glucosamine-6-phosphate deaminase
MSEKPRLIVEPDEQAMSRQAADIVTEALRSNPSAAISLPTGSTSLGMFDELIRRSKNGDLDLSQFHLFCLDEYLGVLPDDPNTLTSWLKRSLIDPAGIPLDHVHTLPVTATDPSAAADEYESSISDRGGLALAVLGIGGNGHIAYNEPGTAVDSRTRVVQLTPESVERAAGYFAGHEVPTRAMTVGVGTLLDSAKIVLIASGTGKAEIVRCALEDPISADVPASWLRTMPQKVTFLIDHDAASLLRNSSSS